MEELTTATALGDDVALELGKVLGQSIAFGTIAGRCSAAQAAAIRQIRNEKVHLRFGLSWREFCPKHLKMCGSQADTFIRLLEEFGSDYFEHTQSVRISADTYRLVAPFIQDKSLHFHEEVLELNSANVQTVAESLREAQQALAPPEEPAEPAEPAAPTLSDRLSALDRRTTEFVAECREVARETRQAEPSLAFRSRFRGVLARINSEIRRVSIENGEV